MDDELEELRGLVSKADVLHWIAMDCLSESECQPATRDVMKNVLEKQNREMHESLEAFAMQVKREKQAC